MRDVFKYLKDSRKLLESTTSERATELGYEYRSRGVWGDPRTGKRYRTDGIRFVEIDDTVAEKKPKAQEDPKTLRDFRKDSPKPEAKEELPPEVPPVADQTARVVPGGPSEVALNTGDVKQIEKQLSRGRENVQSPARKKSIKQQAQDILNTYKQEKDAEEAALATAEKEAEVAQQELDQQLAADAGPPTKDASDFKTIDDVVTQDREETGDEEEDYYDSIERITGEARGKLGEMTARQNANADKKFGALRETLGKIEDPDKQKAFTNALTRAFSYTGRVNSGAGKNALGKVDYELLEANRKRLKDGYGDGSSESIKDFVESTRPIEVSDEEVEVFFEALPTKLQKNFMGAGKISDSYTGHSLGVDKDGNQMRGKLSGKTNGVANGRLRGLMVAKLFLQQGGKDGYTGADLDLNATDLEHVRGFNNKDDGTPTQEMKDQRENVDNFILTASNLNQTKVDKNMDEWYSTEVERLKDFSDDDYLKRDTLTEQSNTVNDKARLVNSLFFDGDKMSNNVTSELFDLYSNNDRQMAKTINSNINKFGKEKGVKLPNVKSRMGYEMIKKLDLGGYMKKKSGRGNQGKLDDKIYSAFVSTLMDGDEEERERLSQVWKDGREIGSQAAFDEQNDGAAKKALIKYVKENGGFADRFLENKEFKRILSESLRNGKLVIESLKRALRDPLRS